MAAPAFEAPDLHDEVIVRALADLRHTRKQRRLGDWHIFDALYKAYMAAIVGGVGVTMLSGLVGDERIGRAGLNDVRSIGPAAVGVAVAVIVGIGLRSGSRGGPLALEAAEVRYVLLAPVDRDVALRPPARRQLRFTAFVGMVTGATIGLLAYRRLPGNPIEWIAGVALIGTAASVAMTGGAMVASGHRIGRRSATAMAALIVAWSGADVVFETTTSPASFLGQLALWPLDARPLSALALLVPVVLAVVGLRAVGGISLEAAEWRGRLVSHLRFAATFQDLRTVMLLRRQLSAEVPRQGPWLRLRPAHRGPVTWRRDWRGILRWPATRFLRLGALGIVAGLSTAAAWSGTTPMVIVAGGALYIAALDAIEGLAQDVDHPDRRDSFPAPAGAIHLRHLAAPTVVLTLAGALGVAAAALAGEASTALSIGLPVLVPGAAAAVGGAAVSTIRNPPDPSRLLLDSTGSLMLFHHAFPPAIATLGPAAVLLARSGARADGDLVGLSLSAALNVTIAVALVFGWVRHRAGLATYLAGGGAKDVGK